jgi:hypothetical protein
MCPLCGTRKARRLCPALGREICAVCCGTKRQVEIACPVDCGYLQSARAHPPAAVTRQRERDFRFALPLIHELPDRAYQLVVLFQSVIRNERKSAFVPLADVTIVDAASTLAATLETAGRGIIYEHQPATLPAQRLAEAFKSVLAEVGRGAGSAADRDAALALRRIADGARRAGEAFGESPTAYLDFLDRLPAELDAALRESDPHTPAESVTPPSSSTSRIIIP